MPILRFLGLWGVALTLGAGVPEPNLGRLEYRVKIRMQGDPALIETRFALVPTPVVTTANRVKKARMGAWRLEAQQPRNAAFSQALVLARVERMLYFAGPTGQTLRQNLVVRFGDKACPVWTAMVPQGVPAYAYLAEVAPGLLALSYFSASFTTGDIASLEIQLEDFHLRPGVAPAEDGTVLLRSLYRLTTTSASGSGDGAVQVVE